MSNSLTTEFITKANDSVKLYSNAGRLSGAAGNNVQMLWLQVLAGDTDAYESIHEIFYPVLFRYGKFITADTEFINAVAEEVFVRCWNNKNSVNGKRLLIELIREMRHEFLIRSAVNSFDAQGRLGKEINFLNKVLKIEWDGVLQIMRIDNYPIFSKKVRDDKRSRAFS